MVKDEFPIGSILKEVSNLTNAPLKHSQVCDRVLAKGCDRTLSLDSRIKCDREALLLSADHITHQGNSGFTV